MSSSNPLRLSHPSYLAVALLTGACAAWCPSAAALDFEVVRVASGLTRPVYVTAPPGDRERIFIVEQHGGNRQGKPGRILVMDLAGGTIEATPFLEIPGVHDGNEQGLLGLAFHPEYASNGYFYVDYTRNGKTHITRFEVSGDPDLADAGSETPVMGFGQPQSNHNAGWMGFGPDDYLYIATGDGGGSYDFGSGHTDGLGNSQDVVLGNMLGKILRIDIDGDDFPGTELHNYAIPDDNPFVDRPIASDPIWSYGLRNPWRASFDRATGDLWIGDVGQGSLEEIDFQPADSPGGENYGWRLREGTIATPPRPGDALDVGGPKPADGIDPIHEYTHGGGRCSVTGGYVYRGPAPSIRGHYFFADYCTGDVWSLRHDGSDPADFDGTNFTDFYNWSDDPDFSPDAGSIGRVTSFGEDDAGHLYIVDGDGEIFRIQPVPEPGAALAGTVSLLCLAALRRRIGRRQHVGSS